MYLSEKFYWQKNLFAIKRTEWKSMQGVSDLLLYSTFVLSVVQIKLCNRPLWAQVTICSKKKCYAETNYMTSEILQKERPGDYLGDPFSHRSKEVKKRKSWSQASGYVNDLKLKVLFLKKKKTTTVPCSSASAKNGCKIGIVHLPLRVLILSASSYLGQPQVS